MPHSRVLSYEKQAQIELKREMDKLTITEVFNIPFSVIDRTSRKSVKM